MFKGIFLPPLPTSYMTTDKWMQLPLRGVRTSEVWATQPSIYLGSLLVGPELEPDQVYCRDPYPHVVFWNGEMYLEDGHHRAVKNGLMGRSVLVVRFLEIT